MRPMSFLPPKLKRDRHAELSADDRARFHDYVRASLRAMRRAAEAEAVAFARAAARVAAGDSK